MRRTAILAAALAACLAVPATAFARPDTRTMTCDQTRSLIQRSGAIVLTTGTHTYDRYVSRSSFACAWEEAPRLAYVRTRDTSQCPVYRCEEAEKMLPFGFDD